MSPRIGPAIQVEGLKELRAAFRATDREALKEIQAGLKTAAGLVAEEARVLAPRRTGALAAGYRPFTRGNVAGVRNRVPYAAIYEFRKTGTPREMARVRPVGRALEHQQDRIVDRLADGVERAAARAGWR